MLCFPRNCLRLGISGILGGTLAGCSAGLLRFSADGSGDLKGGFMGKTDRWDGFQGL